MEQFTILELSVKADSETEKVVLKPCLFMR